MAIYGYVRVSTSKQNIQRQIRNIKAVYQSAIIFKEVFTRTEFYGRKEWNKLMKIVKKGDIIVFDSVSRMSGNVEEGCEIYEMLFKMGVELVFLNEDDINTEQYRKTLDNQIQIQLSTGNTAADNLLNTIIEALNQYAIEIAKERIRKRFEQAEKEVQDLHQRTKEGIITAKTEGKRIGTPKGTKLNTKKAKEAKEIILKHSADFNGTLNDSEVIKLADISRNSFYKYKKELKEGID